MMARVFHRIRILFAGIQVLLQLSPYVLACGTAPASVTAIWSPANLQNMAYALGLLMVVIQGIRYIISDSAQEKAEVKKGLLYVVVGVLVVSGYTNLTDMYCSIAGVSY